MDPIDSSEVFEQDPEMQVTEQADGSAVVTDPVAPQQPQDFFANLAETMKESELTEIASELLELIEKDKEARKKRDEQYEDGIKRTGLGDDAPGGAEFAGASKVVHPALAEACVDFAASSIKELFPPSGPVKTAIQGDAPETQVQRAERKRQYMNWQLTTQMKEYRSELEQLLTQLPLGGSQYQKFRFDERLMRPVSEFVPIDDIFLPYVATDFYTAPRVTHHQKLTEMEFERRVRSGLYRNVKVGTPDSYPEKSKSEEANEKIEGKEADAYNEDGLRSVYEVHCWWEVEGEDQYDPYVITIDEYSEKVLCIYRNWEETDESREKLDWFVEWKFIPWRGAYAIGLPHLIGGLSAALTGALRALMDSAHIQNAPTMLKLKGGRVVGQSTEIDLTQIQEIEGPAGIDDVRKLAMALPFPGPSPVLFQLLGWLTDAAKGVVSTSEEKIADASNQMPVGTTLALIEQGSKVFSAIHARLHESQKRSLLILNRLNGQYLNEQEEIKDLGKLIIGRQDFIGSLDVIPVSDPNIFSESQRFAQAQAIMQMQAGDAADPTIPWNKLEVRRRLLKLMHVEDADKLLPPPPTPVTADPVAENVAAMTGAQLKAGPQQDHMLHIRAHLAFIVSPLVAMDPSPNANLGNLFNHAREHLLFLYQTTAMQGAQQIQQMQQQQMMQQQMMMMQQGGMPQ